MTSLEKISKGERTRRRLLDAAERLFATKGYDPTSLRDVANAAEIKEPGIYNYFSSKEQLYSEVLERALQPLVDTIVETVSAGITEADLVALPGRLTDLLSEHPAMPALFHRALSGSSSDSGEAVMERWLSQLFSQGENLWARFHAEKPIDRARITLRMVLMFNVVTGYFLSQKILDEASVGHVLDQVNLQEQKRLLGKIMQLFILEN